MAVPSSSVNPSGAEVDHEAADADQPPDERSEVDEVRVGRALGGRCGGGAGRRGRRPHLPRSDLGGVVRLGAWRPPSTRTSAGDRGVTAKRLIRRGRVRPAGDPGDRGRAALGQRRARDAGTRLADDDHLGRPDRDLGAPPVAELAGRSRPAR